MKHVAWPSVPIVRSAVFTLMTCGLAASVRRQNSEFMLNQQLESHSFWANQCENGACRAY
jgi:hypothetical protein